MPDVALPAWLAWIIVAGAAAGAITGMAALAVRTGRGMRTVSAWLSDIVRHAVADVVDVRLEELARNGGSSVRDRVAKVDARTEQMVSTLDDHIAKSETDRADLRRWLELHDQAIADIADTEEAP